MRIPHVFLSIALALLSCNASAQEEDRDAAAAKRFSDDRPRAELGDSAAMARVGEAYLLGDGVGQDLAKAVDWFRRGAEKGSGRAMYRLGDLYQVGAGVERDLAKALEWYRRGADAGDPGAMAGLGWMYFHGFAVEKDIDQAVRWYRKGADAGGPEAMNNLGHVYRYGLGVPKDTKRAVEWFRRSVEGGNEWAMDNLGEMYVMGEGVERDAKKGIDLLERAAMRGHPHSAAKLASLLLGVELTPPRGWRQPVANGRPVLGRYEAGEGEDKATVTVVRMPWNDDKQLVTTVNRWRSAVGLDALADADAGKATRAIELDGLVSHRADFSSSKDNAKPQQRLLGAIIPNGPEAILIRMTGPAPAVAREEDAFDAFILSLRVRKHGAGASADK